MFGFGKPKGEMPLNSASTESTDKTNIPDASSEPTLDEIRLRNQQAEDAAGQQRRDYLNNQAADGRLVMGSQDEQHNDMVSAQRSSADVISSNQGPVEHAADQDAKEVA